MKKEKIGAFVIGVMIIGMGVTGCRVGPTYGTGKTSGEQFVEDMSNLVSLKASNSNPQIETRPRPELVRPAAGERAVLPRPQEDVARPGNPDWPESPEARRKRLRDEATANRDNPAYVSPIVRNRGKSEKRYLPNGTSRMHEREDVTPNALTTKKQYEEYRRRKQQSRGGSAVQRKYLSEPPLEYRQPATSAPVGDMGDDEAKKERISKKKKK